MQRTLGIAAVGLALALQASFAQGTFADICGPSHRFTIIKRQTQTGEISMEMKNNATLLSPKAVIALTGNAVFSVSETVQAQSVAGAKESAMSNVNNSESVRGSFEVYDQVCIEAIYSRLVADEQTLASFRATLLQTLIALPDTIVRSKAMMAFKHEVLKELKPETGPDGALGKTK